MNKRRYRREEKQIRRTARQARGGEIILDTPRKRLIFSSGLIGMAIVALFGLALF